MKNISVWFISSFLWLLVLSGCAVHPRFETIATSTSEEAIDELYARSRSIGRFAADTDFTLSGDFGRFQFKGKINYSVDDGWRVKLTGPLGVKLAVVESVGDHFTVYIPHSGITTEIDADSSLEFPELDITFPDLSFLTTLLLPVTVLDDRDEWQIVRVATSKHSTSVTLVGNEKSQGDSLVMSLDYSPLRIYREDLWQDGELQISRRFKYRTDRDNVPDRIIIKVNDLVLEIKYKSIDMEIKSFASIPACQSV